MGKLCNAEISAGVNTEGITTRPKQNFPEPLTRAFLIREQTHMDEMHGLSD